MTVGYELSVRELAEKLASFFRKSVLCFNEGEEQVPNPSLYVNIDVRCACGDDSILFTFSAGCAFVPKNVGPSTFTEKIPDNLTVLFSREQAMQAVSYAKAGSLVTVGNGDDKNRPFRLHFLTRQGFRKIQMRCN